MSFIPNQGQVDGWVKFYGRNGSVSFFFTPTEVVYSFVRWEGEALPRKVGRSIPGGDSGRQGEGKARGHRVKLRFVGANPDPAIEGQQEFPGKVNYFVDNDPSQWKQGLSTYREDGNHRVRKVTANQPPNCDEAIPNVLELWPPSHQMVPIAILGVTDDGERVHVRLQEDEVLPDRDCILSWHSRREPYRPALHLLLTTTRPPRRSTSWCWWPRRRSATPAGGCPGRWYCW